MELFENLEDVGEKIGSTFLLPMALIVDLVVTLISLVRRWEETENVTGFFIENYLSSFGIVMLWTVVGTIGFSVVIILAAITAESIDSWQRKRLNKRESRADAKSKEQAEPEVPKQ